MYVRPERAVAAPPAGRRRVRALVAYDGAAYHGFADNVGVATVAGTLTTTLTRILRGPVELTGAGRTDAGVHARGQVVSFDALLETDLAKVQRSVNSLCAPSIVMRDIAWAPDDFDARFSATWRRYRYQVLNTTWPDPLLTSTAWHVSAPLDLLAMQLACDPFVGEHDFTSFCRRPKPGAGDQPGAPPPSMVRRVLEAGWEQPAARSPAYDPGVLWFHIRATAFCHQMVRSIVGYLVDVGQGRHHAGDVLTALRAKDRAAAGNVAPAQGLVLWDVGYP